MNVKDKLLPLFAVGFPGGYKFLVIMVITFFAGELVANEFSKGFFWVALLVTFSGLPIAALMVSNQYVLSASNKASLVLSSAVISFLVAYFVELRQLSNEMNLVIFISILILSAYEIIKCYFLNSGDFRSIFIASIGTLLLFVFSYLCLSVFYEGTGLILLSSFLSLLLPMILLFFKRVKREKRAHSDFVVILNNFAKYILSNIASTSLMAALPLVIIDELGDGVAANLAQVFYFSTLCYLIPRALSAKHIPNMRKNGINSAEIKQFFLSIFIFVTTVSTIAFPLFYYFYELWLVYLLLFLAMQLSQLTLPFSNVLMVRGDVSAQLKINLSSLVIFLVCGAVIYNLLGKGVARAEWLLVAFCALQLLKLYLGVVKSSKYWQVLPQPIK